MDIVQAYWIGLLVGFIFSGIGFLGWYWLGWLPEKETSINAFSRGFDKGWDAGYASANNNWKDNLRAGVRNIYSDDFTLSQESDLRKAGL